MIKGFYSFSACTDYMGKLGYTINTSKYVGGSEYGIYNKNFDYYFAVIEAAATPQFSYNASNSVANSSLQQSYLPINYYTIYPDIDQLNINFDEEEFEKLVQSPKCVGIGECGLDYFFLKEQKRRGEIENIDREIDRQRDLFCAQIEFAVKHDLPLMIHGRPSKKDEIDNPSGMDAYEDIIFLLKKYKEKYGERVRGNMHFFVGSTEIARECLVLGFTFSLGGVLTITDDYHEMVKSLPLSSILTETDSPYVAPKPMRGKRNSPEYLPYIVEKIADIKRVSEETVRESSLKNIYTIFKIL
jgi:TatD DNase family protein